MRLNLLLAALQDIINAMDKGSTFEVRVLMEETGLWEDQDDLQQMKMAIAFKAMVEGGLLTNIQLITHHKTRHAIYLIT